MTDQGLKSESLTDKQTRAIELFIFGLLFLSAVAVWLARINYSLWLDEGVTAWVLEGGFADVLRRSINFQSSPVYYFLPWLAATVGGKSEAMLRLPSLLAMAASALVLYQLGKLLLDKETGVAAALIFISTNYMAFAAADARPYSVAILSVIGAMYCLIQWLQRRRWHYAAGYVLLASLTVYLHILFSSMFLVHLLLLIWYGIDDRSILTKSMPLMAFSILILLLPYYPQLESLLSRRGILSFARQPSVLSLVRPLVKLSIAIGFGLLAGQFLRSKLRFRWHRIPFGLLLSVVGWTTIPLAVLFVIGAFSPYKLFVTRYYLCAVPGGALLVAILLRALEPWRSRRIIVALTAAVLIAFGVVRLGSRNDWRGLTRVAQSLVTDRSTPVLVATGLIEEKDIDYFHDQLKRSYLLAPIAFYSLDADVVPMPSVFETPAQLDYLHGIVKGRLFGVDRFLVIDHFGFPLRDSIAKRLESKGFRYEQRGAFGMLFLFVFERDESSLTSHQPCKILPIS